MKRATIAAVIIAAGTLSAAAFAFLDETDAPAARVSTVPVSRGSVVQEVQASGTLEAVKTVQVGTQVSGTIQTLNADFNALVRKGQVIATLDPSLFQTQIEQAQATLTKLTADLDRLRVQVDSSKRTLDRTTELAGRQLVSAADLDAAKVDYRMTEAQLKSAEAQVVQARASLNQAQVNLDHTIIRAPIDGIVISRNVDVGQTVAASMSAPTLFVIAEDLSRMQANASIDESDVGSVRPGQVVHFTVDAYPSDQFQGQVVQVRLQPSVVQNVVTYTAIIDVPNPNLKLKPGMTANVVVEIERRDNVLRIPAPALRFKPNVETLAALGLQVEAPTTDGGVVRTAQAAPSSAGAIQPAVLRTEVSTAYAAAHVALSDDGRGSSGGSSAARGTVWVEHGQTLVPVRVTLGVSDGSYVELVKGDLEEGAELVTRVSASATASSTTAAPASSPFLPSGPSFRGR